MSSLVSPQISSIRVTLPCTLWFFDKSKQDSERRDEVLFIDARHLYHQVSRAHREFTPLPTRIPCEHCETLSQGDP